MARTMTDEQENESRAALTLAARVAELEAELVAQRYRAAECLYERNEAQAHANRLRDALETVQHNRTCSCYEDGEPGCCPRCTLGYDAVDTALASTPAASLAAHNAALIERCATAAESYLWNLPAIQSQVGANCGDAIRALAAQKVKS